MNNEEIKVANAVATLRNYCKNRMKRHIGLGGCQTCMLNVNGLCEEDGFKGLPEEWGHPAYIAEGTPVVYIKPMHGGKIPEKKSAGAAWDCYARAGVDVYNGETYKVPLGFALAMPEGVFATLIPRSSLGLKTDLIMANSQGLIDSDYRGEIYAIYRAISLQSGRHDYIPSSSISAGNRIAQIYFNEPVELVVVDEFPDEVKDTERGESGFGSTGK